MYICQQAQAHLHGTRNCIHVARFACIIHVLVVHPYIWTYICAILRAHKFWTVTSIFRKLEVADSSKLAQQPVMKASLVQPATGPRHGECDTYCCSAALQTRFLQEANRLTRYDLP